MSDNGTLKSCDSAEKPVIVDSSLEIIPESKKEDSPDRLPLQIAQPEKKVEEVKLAQDKENPRVLAASELPLVSGQVVPASKIEEKVESAPEEKPKEKPEEVVNGNAKNEPAPHLTLSEKKAEVAKIPEELFTPLPLNTVFPADSVDEASSKDMPVTNSAKEDIEEESPPKPEKSVGPLKSVANSSRKGSKSKPTSRKVLTKEKAKETLYEKALKEFTSTKKSVSRLDSKTPKPKAQTTKAKSMIPEEQRVLFCQMRESLLSLQKRDAVTRQTIEKLQKEKQALEEEKKRKEQAIDKCEKTRVIEGSTIAKQEEMIAKLRIDQQAAERIL